MKERCPKKYKFKSILYVRNYMPRRNLLFFTGLIMYFLFITFLFDIFQLFEKLILQSKKCLTGRNTHQTFAEKNNQVREKVNKEKPFFILSSICAVLKWTKELAASIACKDFNQDHQHWVNCHTLWFIKPDPVSGVLHLFANMVTGVLYGCCSCKSTNYPQSDDVVWPGYYRQRFAFCT